MGKDLKGKELGEGISQIKDGRCIGRFTDEYGKRITVYAKTFKEIKDKLNKARYEQALYAGRGHPNKNIILKELYDEWIINKEQNVRVSTVTNCKNIYRNHIADFGLYKLSKITPSLLSEYFRQLYNQQYSAYTIYYVKEIFTNLLSFAVKKQYLDKNPFELFEMPKRIKDKLAADKMIRDEQHYLTKEQRELFFEYTDRNKCYLGDFYKFLLSTGLRISEAVALTWDCVNLKKDIIYIRNNFVQYYENGVRHREYNALPKTASSIRTIPITKQTKELLLKQSKTSSTPYVFCSKKGEPLVPKNVASRLTFTVDKINEELKTKAEKNKESYDPLPSITPHYFRHTFATICLEQGMHPKFVQKLLGHSSIEITLNLYTHLSSDYKADELLKIEGIL